MQRRSIVTTANASAPRWPLRFIVDHNPFYILSGLCMLLGCYLLSDALHTSAGDIPRLLVVLAVVNLYEAMIIPLGLVLIRRPGFVRDGWMLLLLELLFLIDIVFTQGIIATVEARAGLLVGLAILAVSAIKITVIVRMLRLPNPGRTIALIVLQIAALLAVPVLFKHLASPLRNGMVPLPAVYLSWVAAGLIPILGTMLWRFGCQRSLLGHPQRVLGWLYIGLPFASLLAHLYSAGWVYSVAWLDAYLAPVLLGCAVALLNVEQWLATRQNVARLQFVLVAAALWLSLSFPRGLIFGEMMVLSPLRLMLLGSVLVCICAAAHHRSWSFAFFGGLCLAGVMLGPTTALIWTNLIHLQAMLLNLGRRAIPRTTMDWGIAAVISSFVLLLAGALLSLRKNMWLKEHPEA
jgi:hypothetical protein